MVSTKNLPQTLISVFYFLYYDGRYFYIWFVTLILLDMYALRDRGGL